MLRVFIVGMFFSNVVMAQVANESKDQNNLPQPGVVSDQVTLLSRLTALNNRLGSYFSMVGSDQATQDLGASKAEIAAQLKTIGRGIVGEIYYPQEDLEAGLSVLEQRLSYAMGSVAFNSSGKEEMETSRFGGQWGGYTYAEPGDNLLVRVSDIGGKADMEARNFGGDWGGYLPRPAPAPVPVPETSGTGAKGPGWPPRLPK